MKRFSLPVAYANYLVTPVVKFDDHGKCDFDLRTIIVARNAHRDAMRATLWHEFFHAVFHELGYAELRDDEALVEGLALSLMRVRAEVPWL